MSWHELFTKYKNSTYVRKFVTSMSQQTITYTVNTLLLPLFVNQLSINKLSYVRTY